MDDNPLGFMSGIWSSLILDFQFTAANDKQVLASLLGTEIRAVWYKDILH